MHIEIISNILNELPHYIVKEDGSTLLSQSNVTPSLLKDKKISSESQLLKFLEGGEEIYREKKVQKRNTKLRAEAIKQNGYSCYVCGFNFEDIYGNYGRGYIEVHHLKLLAATKEKIITTVEDVAVVCSNCHSVLHRQGIEPMPIDELKKIVKEKKLGRKTY
jgi:predicted HNH restriction endonuclease